MSLDGQLIYCAQDPYGELRVFDDGTTRTLSFGPGNEQSACLKAKPDQLLYEYTQAMLLALLFCAPRKVLCLGLGAGSLVTTLQHHCKGMRFTAVELRQAVIDIARDYFYLPQGKRVTIHCGDAADFVATDTGHYDLIFSDLYTALGLAPVQLQTDFLRQTAARLKPDGLLVINCWREHQRNEDTLLASLSELFVDLRSCPTGDGNWILFAARWPLESRPKQLRQAAEDWSDRLKFSLLRHLRQLENPLD